MEILIATTNQFKVEEYREIFKNYPINFLCLKDINLNVNIEENGNNYYKNALIKINEVSKYYHGFIIADDSGIELNNTNFPGIYSQRFMSKFPSRIDCLNYVINNYLNKPASFKSNIVFKDTNNNIYSFEGEIKGTIVKIRKLTPFGYDPIFLPLNNEKTFSELNGNEKNKISHRYLASKKLLDYLIKNNFYNC